MKKFTKTPENIAANARATRTSIRKNPFAPPFITETPKESLILKHIFRYFAISDMTEKKHKSQINAKKILTKKGCHEEAFYVFNHIYHVTKF